MGASLRRPSPLRRRRGRLVAKGRYGIQMALVLHKVQASRVPTHMGYLLPCSPFDLSGLTTRWSRPGQPEVTKDAILALAGRAAHLEAVGRLGASLRNHHEAAAQARVTLGVWLTASPRLVGNRKAWVRAPLKGGPVPHGPGRRNDDCLPLGGVARQRLSAAGRLHRRGTSREASGRSN